VLNGILTAAALAIAAVITNSDLDFLPAQVEFEIGQPTEAVITPAF
jgi:hypothetical protein